MESLTGRKVAIDASMALYQFLVAVRSSSGNNGGGGGYASTMLTNEAGEVTSHIQGMFNRTIKMMTSGIKPVYVFDGKAPEMKGGELAKRTAKRAKAQADLEVAKASEDADNIDKFSRRLVKVTRQHNEDCQELLRLMGVPFIVALSEAEAQCAELAKKGKVYATATEDMDALTFRTPKLLRKLTFSQGKDKQPIIEIDMEGVLRGLQLTYEQFVDLCILCGCDYTGTIKGIGPKTALKLIRTYKSLEVTIAHLKRDKKYEIPADWHTMRVAKSTLAAVIADSVEEVAGENKDDVEMEKDEIAAELEAQTEESALLQTEVSEAEGRAVNDTDDEMKKNQSNEDLEDTPTRTPNDDAVDMDLTLDAAITLDDLKDDVVVIGELREGEEFEEIPPLYVQARALFITAPVHPADDVDLKWSAPDEEGLKTFLIDKMGFSAERVASGIKRLQEAQLKKSQQRMDSFFTILPKAAETATGVKRKLDDKSKVSAKKGPGAGKFGRR